MADKKKKTNKFAGVNVVNALKKKKAQADAAYGEDTAKNKSSGKKKK